MQFLEKLWKIKRRGNYLVSEPNYNTTRFFPRKSITNRNENMEILTNETVYLRL